MTSLIDVLQPNAARGAQIAGVVTGIVTNNSDPDGLARVRVRFPWLADDAESWWARVATPMAGPDRGLYTLPEVDDEVLVAFEHGDPNRPYVVGSLWNGSDAPPESNPDGKNPRRTIKSRSGHVISLDDSDDAPKIEIVDGSGSNKITIDAKENKIEIVAGGDVSISTDGGKLTLSGKGIEIKSTAEVKVEAESTLDLKASGAATVKGSVVKLN